MSAHCPNRCTGTIAFTRERFSVSLSNQLLRRAGSMLNVRGSTSTNTGTAPSRGHGAGGGEERKGRRDDQIAGADVEGHQRDEQRVGARRDAYRVLDADVVGHRPFENASSTGPPM